MSVTVHAIAWLHQMEVAEQGCVMQRIGKNHAQAQCQQRKKRRVKTLAHALAHTVGRKIDCKNGDCDG